MAHPNQALIEKAVKAFIAGDIETMKTLAADDVILHVPGTNQLSGDYKGQGELFGSFFPKVMQLTDQTYTLQPHEVIGTDEHLVGIYNVKATRNGKTLEWRQVNVYHPRDGKIAEAFVQVFEFEAWNAFFS